MKRAKGGFTLIEILAALGIIALLSGFLFPVFVHAREKGRQSRCVGNLHQIYHALQAYASDWDGSYPLSLANAFPHTPSTAPNPLLACLSDEGDIDESDSKEKSIDPLDRRSSYAYAGDLLKVMEVKLQRPAAYMEMNHPQAGLAACAHHGYIRNRSRNRTSTIIRLAFDGSVKTIPFTPRPKDNPRDGQIYWSSREVLGWSSNGSATRTLSSERASSSEGAARLHVRRHFREL